jgi:hypothetical protein
MVGRNSRAAYNATDRRAINDRAADLFLHLPKLMLHARPDTALVDGADPVIIFGRLVCDIRRWHLDAALLYATSRRPNSATVRSTMAAT